MILFTGPYKRRIPHLYTPPFPPKPARLMKYRIIVRSDFRRAGVVKFVKNAVVPSPKPTFTVPNTKITRSDFRRKGVFYHSPLPPAVKRRIPNTLVIRSNYIRKATIWQSPNHPDKVRAKIPNSKITRSDFKRAGIRIITRLPVPTPNNYIPGTKPIRFNSVKRYITNIIRPPIPGRVFPLLQPTKVYGVNRRHPGVRLKTLGVITVRMQTVMPIRITKSSRYHLGNRLFIVPPKPDGSVQKRIIKNILYRFDARQTINCKINKLLARPAHPLPPVNVSRTAIELHVDINTSIQMNVDNTSIELHVDVKTPVTLSD